ncbi:MAG: hypothetical protein ABFC89_12670 [Methanospirillum sp.]
MIIRARVWGETAAIVERAFARDPEMIQARLIRDALRAWAREQKIEVPA